MTRSKKSKMERILSKGPIPIKVSHDDKGNFLYYCTYGVHYGVLGNAKGKGCEEKNCYHLRKLRE